ncbi:MAG: sodium-dependent transporter [Alistipes sp.]|nr:sodium-dependent transporter [Alistipes sp.]
MDISTQMAKRSTFGSRFGTIAVVGGSVIGLGNIWRFPYVAGENGGGTFLLIYVVISFLISVPIMLSEFTIGRASRRNSMRAFRKLSGIRAWRLTGYLGILTAFTILSFYSVIAGWALEFIRQSATGEFMSMSPAEIEANFNGFVASGWKPFLWTLGFVAAMAIIVGSGIEKGIERFNKTAMPLMFVILVIMCVHVFTLPGFREGISFLLRPDFSKAGGGTVLQAIGQSFFSLSLGMGIMVTYGSYIKKEQNMFRLSGTVVIADMSIAILSGLAIFPAVFSFGISPSSGPELVFLTLPNIFTQMTGGQVLSLLFFVLLFAAAITSSMSLLEVVVAYVSEEFRLRRRTATLIAVGAVLCVATLCLLSQMPGSGLLVMGSNVFDFLDKTTSTYTIPLEGLLIVLFAGWVMDKGRFRREMTNDGRFGTALYGTVSLMVKFVIPVVLVILFLNQLGIIKV